MAESRFHTVMIVPDGDGPIKKFNIPVFLFRSLWVISTALMLIFGVMLFDYWQVLGKIHENQHLSRENRLLREQLQLFQIKLDGLSHDISRVETFEHKLRVITGLKVEEASKPLRDSSESGQMMDDLPVRKYNQEAMKQDQDQEQHSHLNHDHSPTHPEPEKESHYQKMRKTYSKDQEFVRLQDLYQQKITSHMGLKNNLVTDFGQQINDLRDRYALFDYSYNFLKQLATQLETRVHQLDSSLLDQQSLLNSTPTIMPVVGWVTSFFGPRISPYSKRLKMHEGIDIGAPNGTSIIAPADGIVTFAGHKPGFGNFVQIDHGYGVETLFAHAKSIKTVNGKKVERGEMIATVGSTGYSTGPHLHYEVRINGVAVDPLYFVLN